MYKLSRNWYKQNNQGDTIVFAMVVVLIVFIIGASLVLLSGNEAKKSTRSNKLNAALYVAEGGVRQAMWELDRGSYNGETDTSLGEGTFTVSVSTPAGYPDQREIISTGQIGSSQRKVKVLCERISADVTVNSAVQCNGPVKVKGDSEISGGTLTAILVPIGTTPQIQKEENVTGAGAVPPAASWGNAIFPSFEDTFGVTMSSMSALAATHYTNPGNNPTCHGITWVDGNVTLNSTWNGSGILIVNGDFDMSGGAVFNGVIYVLGAVTMHGNCLIHGALLCAGSSEMNFNAGTPRVEYDALSIIAAGNLFPFHLLTWQELKI